VLFGLPLRNVATFGSSIDAAPVFTFDVGVIALG